MIIIRFNQLILEQKEIIHRNQSSLKGKYKITPLSNFGFKDLNLGGNFKVVFMMYLSLKQECYFEFSRFMAPIIDTRRLYEPKKGSNVRHDFKPYPNLCNIYLTGLSNCETTKGGTYYSKTK